MKVEVAAPVGDRCGEGAVWSAAERAVWWTDINRFLVHRFDEDTGAVRSWLFDEPAVGLSLTAEPGRMLVCLASKLIWWWPATDRRQDHGFRLEGFPRVRLNDGRTDPLGNFWVGSMKNNVLPDGELGDPGPGEGKLFRIAPDGTVTVWAENLGISNTLCWSHDRRTFYFGDTLDNVLWAFDYDAGQITNRRDHFRGFDRGLLWNCRFGGGCIARVGPDGALKGTIDIGVPNVTTCVFGGHDLKTLYITTASIVTPPGNRLAGSLFRTRVDIPGMAENLMAIP